MTTFRKSAQFFVAGVGAVTGFAAVAFGHPDGFDGLAVGELKEVADGAVGGGELLLDSGESDGVAGFGELAAQGNWQGGELVEGRPALAVEAV